MTTGVVSLRMKNGKEASSPYCARCVVDDAGASSPRIKIWQGWFVSLLSPSYFLKKNG